MAKKTQSSDAVRALDTRAKGQYKENVQQYVDSRGNNVPEGTYECKLSIAKLYMNRKNDPQVDFVFVVTDGEYEGEQIRDMHGMNESGKRTIDLALRIMTSRLQQLGVDTSDIKNGTALDAALQELTERSPSCEVNVTESNYGAQVRYVKLIGETIENGQATEEAPFEEETTDEEEVQSQSDWNAGDWVTVNDPNDDDSPWNGEVVTVLNDTECEVKSDDTGDVWNVRNEYLSPYEE